MHYLTVVTVNMLRELADIIEYDADEEDYDYDDNTASWFMGKAAGLRQSAEIIRNAAESMVD